MPYSHTNWGQLKTQLASRLGDSGSVFWTDTELGVWLTEALRTFGVLSAFWRARSQFSTTAGTAFYDITTQASGSPTLASLLGYTVTDRDAVQQIQYALLESASSQSAWTGTEQFTLNDLRYAIQRRRDQFLSDTGCVLTRSVVNVNSPSIGRQQLTDTIIDVRRAAWVGLSPFNYYTSLWRDDERGLTLADQTWDTDPRTPQAYSIMAPPPLELQLAPIPITNGQLDLITVNSGAALDPASSATVLGIPDDLTPAIKWGALSDLLSLDGPARDQARADYCETRYQQYVQLARLMSCIVSAEINGVPTIPDTLYNLDAGVNDWQNNAGTPDLLAVAGLNLVSLYKVPDGVYSVTLDVVRKAPIPTTDATHVQVGREQLDTILDYAEHLALFKIAGSEFNASQAQADRFLLQSITYNQRLSASARYVIAAGATSQREKSYRPRRSQSDGLGAQPSVQESQSFVPGNAPVRMRRS